MIPKAWWGNFGLGHFNVTNKQPLFVTTFFTNIYFCSPFNNNATIVLNPL